MSAITPKMDYLKTHWAGLVVRLLFLVSSVLVAKELLSQWTLYQQFAADPQAFLTGYQARGGITEGVIRGTFYLYFFISAAVCAGLWFPAKKWWALWQWLVLFVLHASAYDWLHIQLDSFYRCCGDAITDMARARASYLGDFFFLFLAWAIIYIRPPRRKYYLRAALAFLLLRAAAFYFFPGWFRL